MPTTRTTRRGTTGLVEYWNETSRPLVSLLFVLPMLVTYEAGLWMLGPSNVMRNGADDWLRRLLQLFGFGQYLLLPILTCGILLAWHHLSGEKWRVRWSVMSGMMMEAALYGFLLLALAQLQGAIAQSLLLQIPTVSDVAREASGSAGRLIAYLGAGIYEELLFRLMLLPTIALVLRGVQVPAKTSWLLAAVLCSLLFSAAHFECFVGSGDPFSLYRFLFRFIAGIYFSAVFLARGFGIAAAAHACYDVLATMAVRG